MKTHLGYRAIWLVMALLATGIALYPLRYFLPNDLGSWFSQAGLIAMIGWAILIFGPRRWPSLSAFPAYLLPAVLSLGYAVLILRHFGSAEGGYNSLADVAKLLSNEHILLAGGCTIWPSTCLSVLGFPGRQMVPVSRGLLRLRS